MKTTSTKTFLFPLLAAVLGASSLFAEYLWQTPQAKVSPTGALEWAPEPFEFQAAGEVRYIDYAGGDDGNPGTREAPWKHHPWDPQASGQAARGGDADTFVFKRGVTYRGSLEGGRSGTAETPVRITSDPSWGSGDAMIVGSERVVGFTRGADLGEIPDAENVWVADLDFAPRTLWVRNGEGEWERLPIARTPNWVEEEGTYDVRSQWWKLDQPEWWTQGRKKWVREVNGTKMHLGVDRDKLTRDADYYEDGLIWSEWGIMMGAPYAAPIEKYFPKEKAVAFQGPWHRDTGIFMENNRYYIEDKPHYLDAPGEWWFDKEGGRFDYKPGQGGRLYVRLPDDADPDSAWIEAGKRINLIDLENVSHIEVSGLRFMLTNVFWNLDYRFFQHPDVQGAAVRILGSGQNITVRNNRFDHVVSAVRIDSLNSGGPLDQVVVSDNEVNHTDHRGINVEGNGKGSAGRLLHAEILRNKLYDIGARPFRPNGHFAVLTSFPETAVIAGNILEWTYAAGIDTTGGKGSNVEGFEAPLSRILIFNNQVVDSVLGSNDWGGIETWQGGPFYVFNNVSGNALGPFHWTGNTFSHAYYMDGAFKNYFFNNIAWGRDFEEDWLANVSGFQEIHSYQNTIFNNTVYNFLKGSRRQKPEPGRNQLLGNIWQDIKESVFRHSDTEGEDPNTHHAGKQGDEFAYETNAYANNVFYEIGDVLGTFEAEGGDYRDLEEMRAAMDARNALASSIGVMADQPPLRDAEAHDFRPAPGSAAIDFGVRAFVPWSLYATVGEWNFVRNNKEPSVVIDDSWYLTSYHKSRNDYETRPTHPLIGHNVSAEDYTVGVLDDWAPGALRLNGTDQYLTVTRDTLATPFEIEKKVKQTSGGWAEVTVPKTLKAGKKATVSITLKDPPQGRMIGAHLHWMKGGGFGGFNAWGGPERKITGKGPYTWTYTPEMKDGLSEYMLTVFISPDGNFGNATKTVRHRIAPGDGTEMQTVALGGDSRSNTRTVAITGKDLKNPEVHDSSFILEVYVKIDDGATGIIAKNATSDHGYSLVLNDAGKPVFEIAGGGKTASVTGSTAVNDGQWTHILAEADRDAGKLNLYVDGERAASASGFADGDGSLANEADLVVGGSPEGGHLAATFDFMRIALGSLADSKTTIEELHAWQFDGPFLRDFTGRDRRERNDAGAILGR